MYFVSPIRLVLCSIAWIVVYGPTLHVESCVAEYREDSRNTAGRSVFSVTHLSSKNTALMRRIQTPMQLPNSCKNLSCLHHVQTNKIPVVTVTLSFGWHRVVLQSFH